MAAELMTDQEREIFLKLHEALKAKSLWQYAVGSYSPIHDIGLDMFQKKQDYLNQFEQQAGASALQLCIAQLLGLVTYNVPSSVNNVNQVPAEILPYFGLNVERDSQKPMAFMSDVPGRFESGVSRRVVVNPVFMDSYVGEYGSDLLTEEETTIAVLAWQRLFMSSPKAASEPSPS